MRRLEANAAVAIAVAGVEEPELLIAEFFARERAVAVGVELIAVAYHHDEHRRMRRPRRRRRRDSGSFAILDALDHHHAPFLVPLGVTYAFFGLSAFDVHVAQRTVIGAVETAVVIGVKFVEHPVGLRLRLGARHPAILVGVNPSEIGDVSLVAHHHALDMPLLSESHGGRRGADAKPDDQSGSHLKSLNRSCAGACRRWRAPSAAFVACVRRIASAAFQR